MCYINVLKCTIHLWEQQTPTLYALLDHIQSSSKVFFFSCNFFISHCNQINKGIKTLV